MLASLRVICRIINLCPWCKTSFKGERDRIGQRKEGGRREECNAQLKCTLSVPTLFAGIFRSDLAIGRDGDVEDEMDAKRLEKTSVSLLRRQNIKIN